MRHHNFVHFYFLIFSPLHSQSNVQVILTKLFKLFHIIDRKSGWVQRIGCTFRWKSSLKIIALFDSILLFLRRLLALFAGNHFTNWSFRIELFSLFKSYYWLLKHRNNTFGSHLIRYFSTDMLGLPIWIVQFIEIIELFIISLGVTLFHELIFFKSFAIFIIHY